MGVLSLREKNEKVLFGRDMIYRKLVGGAVKLVAFLFITVAAMGELLNWLRPWLGNFNGVRITWGAFKAWVTSHTN